MRKRFTYALLAALISGCNLAPTYQQPALSVPDSFPETATSDGLKTRLATDLGWKEFFGDERLAALIETALENNRELAQSLSRVAQARAQFGIQDSARLPSIGAGAGYTRAMQPMPTQAAGGGSGSAISDSYDVGVSISSFELDLWGRVKNLSDQAQAQYLASEQGARAFRLSLIRQVAAAYYDIMSGGERIELAQEALRGRVEGQKIALRRLDAGVTSTVDYDQAVLLTTQAKTELAELERSTDQARNLLAVLIGGPHVNALPPGRSLSDSQLFPGITAGLPSSLLSNRPDILQAEFNLRAANANVGAARAAFFPSIALTGNYGFVAPALGDLFKGSAKSWSYGPSIDLPLFDWGRRTSELELSRAQADELVNAYQSAVQEAFRDVADGLVARKRYTEQLAALGETVTTQQRLAYTAQRRYDQGLSIYLEVLDAQRNLFAAQQQLIDLRAVALQNDVALYVALGGGLRDSFSSSPPSIETF